MMSRILSFSLICSTAFDIFFRGHRRITHGLLRPPPSFVVPRSPPPVSEVHPATFNHLTLGRFFKARAGRNKPTDDDVFLETGQVVFVPANGRVDENFCRVLE